LQQYRPLKPTQYTFLQIEIDQEGDEEVEYLQPLRQEPKQHTCPVCFEDVAARYFLTIGMDRLGGAGDAL
jgi:hypothetical protein